ncbi:MAG: hypothetical protein KJ964_02390 [Verrucomicrobia bacterium]|nr:hypothetical protein [Verrucomicrobiota bacterium]MBU1735901.1 hypothetical protein [Verrucomicrobiota bacterium]MBU1857137.1 hypothetical protein [Verrucomicrobiota bacterium]
MKRLYPWITFAVFRYFSIVKIKKRLTKHNVDLRILKSKGDLIQAEADLETKKAISLMRIDEHKRILEQNAANQERSFASQREQEKISMEFDLLKYRLSREQDLRLLHPDLVLPHTPLGKTPTQNQK